MRKIVRICLLLFSRAALARRGPRAATAPIAGAALPVRAVAAAALRACGSCKSSLLEIVDAAARRRPRRRQRATTRQATAARRSSRRARRRSAA
jgi:hypothetical protein